MSPVERDLAYHLGAIRFVAAVHVVQREPGRDAGEVVVDLRWPTFGDRIEARPFPAADEVGFVGENRRKQEANLRRVVLKVAVHGDNITAARMQEA